MMKQSLVVQLLVLLGLSLVLGIINNLRPDAHIRWVRDWAPYSSISQESPEPVEAAETTPAANDTVVDETALAQETADLVTSNLGITDIGLDQAVAIHKYASEFTLWVDARDPDLFEQGRIAGAELCYLYDKNTYLPMLRAKIEELQPISLVIYCKGKECTDSHHLAQDLQSEGFENLFVYKDGFDDWYAAGHPIEGALADSAPSGDAAVASTDAEPAVDEGMMMGETAAMIESNFGITDIGIDQAKQIHTYGRDMTVWIDARDPELYAEGHIEGSILCHLYEKNTYLPDVRAKIVEAGPLALVVYCKGKECTDSHHLAEDLQGEGFGNIFVFKDGFDDWYSAGLPIAGRLAEKEPVVETASAEPVKREALEEEKAPGMYVEHIVRDMAPFFYGLLVAVFWVRARESKAWLMTSCAFVALFFVYAALPKVASPLLFAKNIWNYDIAPGVVINISALVLPMVELVAAIGIMTKGFRKASAVIITGLLIIFVVAVSFNVLRGHEFDCGCTASKPFFPELYWEGWNDKYTLILRDLGLGAMSVLAYFGLRKKQES